MTEQAPAGMAVSKKGVRSYVLSCYSKSVADVATL